MKKLLTLMLAISLMFIFPSCRNEETITGNEWLLMQESCFDDLEAFANGMDEVYTLYIIESITATDFLAELKLLNQQYKLLVAYYEELKTNNPIEPESHSFLSKKGTESMENIYSCIGEILNASLDPNGNPLPQNQLAYRYLAFRQTLSEHISGYMTAIQWYKSEAGMYEEDTSVVSRTNEREEEQ